MIYFTIVTIVKELKNTVNEVYILANNSSIVVYNTLASAFDFVRVEWKQFCHT